ncbi:hypothetical protein LWC34_26745 [Kibdelosporangium philippinense]|uniref:Uncharacterized protein n=1 Tax=Kibdelosporangium philippinense TaxID=211113 RepID=A0ABS8ZH72_9PSEU|nr:hypothetical protein [Kibdelosporangium philippinense]MCE7006403.1 hypothetical protein [Kibdelosporangium philippinense]
MNPAFTFWLDYLDARGGLWERSGDAVLAVLPEQLAATHDLPESALITDDPDISREDGVLFLGAGHPEIARAAESVISNGDVSALTLPHRGQPLSTEDLLARIRELVAVDHGRIDATSAPIRAHRATVRLAALVTHTVSAEDQFTEVVECLVDIPTWIDWPEKVAAQLREAMTVDVTPGRRLPADVITPALAAAHQVLDATATARGRILATGADAERDAELTRAREYYAAALAAIDKRRIGADPQRTALLDARAEATAAERDRRMAEIEEKYRHQHELRPYRLHLVDIPVWRLDTDVRRGDRRWPVTFDYLPLTGTLAPTRCLACDAHAPLVATKTGLRCTSCVPSKPEPPAPPTATKPPKDDRRTHSEQPKPRPTPQAPDKPAPTPVKKKPAPVATPPARKSAPAGPVLPRKAEERKVADFWQLVAAGERRKLARLIASNSPLAALNRLYGPAGPAFGIGVPVGETPVSFTCHNYDEPVAGQRGGTAGVLQTDYDQYQYLLLWSRDRLIEEILPYSMPWHPGTIARFRSGSVTHAPPSHVPLDQVAALLLTKTTPRHGLTFTARALAAWWRLPDLDDLLAQFSPPVLAAAVDRAVRYWSGAAQATYPEVAEAFRADQAAVRKATPILQKRLQLSGTTNW